MDQAISTQTPRRDRLGRPLLSDHPFPRAVEAAGGTIKQWAKKHSANVKTVRAWYAVGDAGRRIPQAIAETIEREFGDDKDGKPRVPANLKTWPNGIR